MSDLCAHCQKPILERGATSSCELSIHQGCRESHARECELCPEPSKVRDVIPVSAILALLWLGLGPYFESRADSIRLFAYILGVVMTIAFGVLCYASFVTKSPKFDFWGWLLALSISSAFVLPFTDYMLSHRLPDQHYTVYDMHKKTGKFTVYYANVAKKSGQRLKIRVPGSVYRSRTRSLRVERARSPLGIHYNLRFFTPR